MAQNKALLIYNPTAGSAQGPQLWLGTCVHKLCQEGNYATTVLSTNRDTTAQNIFAGHPEKPDLIVIAGGDGSVRMAIDAMMREGMQEVPLGIIPLGTGNLLARNLGVFEENILFDPIERALNHIINGERIRIDLGKMNDQYFAAAAGVGPLSDAIITPDRRDKENWKMLAYAGSMVQTLAQPPLLFKVVADGEEFKINASGIFITNIKDLGVGMLSESASMHDGMLDLCVLSPKEFVDYLQYGFHFAGGSTITGGKAPYYVKKVKQVEIDILTRRKPLSFIEQGWRKIKYAFTGQTEGRVAQDRAIAMIDGDAFGSTPMKIEIVPDAITVIKPAQNSLGR